MNLFKTSLYYNGNEIFINLDNVTAILEDDKTQNAIFDCIGDDENRTYFTNEPYPIAIKRILQGDLLEANK